MARLLPITDYPLPITHHPSFTNVIKQKHLIGYLNLHKVTIDTEIIVHPFLFQNLNEVYIQRGTEVGNKPEGTRFIISRGFLKLSRVA